MSLWDVYENSRYGDFADQHIDPLKPDTDIIAPCEMLDKKCKTAYKLDAFVAPYLDK